MFWCYQNIKVKLNQVLISKSVLFLKYMIVTCVNVQVSTGPNITLTYYLNVLFYVHYMLFGCDFIP